MFGLHDGSHIPVRLFGLIERNTQRELRIEVFLDCLLELVGVMSKACTIALSTGIFLFCTRSKYVPTSGILFLFIR